MTWKVQHLQFQVLENWGLGFTPIINPPEVAILAVSNMQRKLVLLNDEAEEGSFTNINVL